MTKRSRSSKHWLERQKRDQFSKMARKHGHPSRAHYKLKQLDERFGLFIDAKNVLELGGAPGGWTQYIEEKITRYGRLITVDPLEVKTGENSIHVAGRVGSECVDRRISEILNGLRIDVVLSDMAPNISGIRSRDQAKSARLNDLTIDLVRKYLKSGGSVVMKSFQGPEVVKLVEEMENYFSSVRIVKPEASRKVSSEIYVVAQGFRAAGLPT